MAALLHVLGATLLATGLALATIGLYGLLRRPGMFAQLHAGGLITGPAIVVTLLASVASGSVEIITSAAVLILFLLITSPLSTSAIAQAAHRASARSAEPVRSGDRRPPPPAR